MFLAYYSLGLYLIATFTIALDSSILAFPYRLHIYHGNTVKHEYSATSIIRIGWDLKSLDNQEF